MDEEADIPLSGKLVIRRPDVADSQILLLLWGRSGCGKTTLASTAPGVKLWLQFDPKATNPIASRNDIRQIELDKADASYVVQELTKPNPFNLRSVLKEHPEIETLVVDSMTELRNKCTDRAIQISKNSTDILPGQNGWTAANRITKRAIEVLIQLATDLKLNLIFILHEGNPITNGEGATIEIPPSLSRNMIEPVAAKMGEAWYMDNTGNQYKIMLRPKALHKFAKTRMFNATKESEFLWKFDTQTMKGDGISNWLETWRKSGGAQIALPK